MSRFAMLFAKDVKNRDPASIERADFNLKTSLSQDPEKLTQPAIHMALKVDTRRAARFLPTHCQTSLQLSNGERCDDARIVNLSRYGVMISADFSKLSPLDVVKIGSKTVDYVRRDQNGVAFGFAEPLSLASCNPLVRL